MKRSSSLGFLLLIAFIAGCGTKSIPMRKAPPVVSGATTSEAAPPPELLRSPYAATLVTSRGKIRIVFYDDAPQAKANFVDLAVGTKTWTDPGTGQPVQRPFYDGTQIHRVMPDVLIQGGMPALSGSTTTATGPGFQFEDDHAASRKFDKPGLVGMASAGPNSNGSQFFITLAPLPWLEGKHVVFGEVAGGLDVVRAISQLPRDKDDRPIEPVVIRQVRIEYR